MVSDPGPIIDLATGAGRLSSSGNGAAPTGCRQQPDVVDPVLVPPPARSGSSQGLDDPDGIDSFEFGEFAPGVEQGPDA